MKYRKKIYAMLIFMAAFLVLGTGFVVEAANPVSVMLTDCSNDFQTMDSAGKVYRLRIYLKQSQQINAFQFKIDFDKGLLKVYQEVGMSDEFLNKYNKNNSAMLSCKYNENKSNIVLAGIQLDDELAKTDSGTVLSDVFFQTGSSDVGECVKQLESVKCTVEVLEDGNGNMVDGDSSWVINAVHNVTDNADDTRNSSENSDSNNQGNSRANNQNSNQGNNQNNNQNSNQGNNQNGNQNSNQGNSRTGNQNSNQSNSQNNNQNSNQNNKQNESGNDSISDKPFSGSGAAVSGSGSEKVSSSSDNPGKENAKKNNNSVKNSNNKTAVKENAVYIIIAIASVVLLGLVLFRKYRTDKKQKSERKMQSEHKK